MLDEMCLEDGFNTEAVNNSLVVAHKFSDVVDVSLQVPSHSFEDVD